ncbi:MAG: hypothetical protein KC543_16150 [Myxococcales bacterium]|nr:hypothetical protein [Myxococcales bacterium]
MTTLLEALQDDARRAAAIDDCVALIDGEVARKSGLGGAALKMGYKAVQGVRPGFVRHVVEALLPDFADALEPLHEQAVAAGKPLDTYFDNHRGEVSEALLSVTDAKAAESSNSVVKGAYKRLRGGAKKHVEEAAPGLGALLERHAG